MKFIRIILIICLCFNTVLNAQESNQANDFFSELANRKITSEELKAAENKEEQADEITFRNTSTQAFFIIGEEAFRFSYIREVISHCEAIVFEYLGLKVNPNDKIKLRIIPYTDTENTNQFSFEIDSNASTYLSLRWDKNLEYDAFCRFIMGAMLRKIAIERKFIDDKKDIPYFLELGLSTILQSRAKTGLSSILAKDARQNRLLSLKDSLEMKKDLGDFKNNELSSYWNLRALNRFYSDKSKLHKTCIGLIKSTQNSEIDIYKDIESTYTEGDIEIYFKCIVNFELNTLSRGILTMEDSAEELLRLSFVRKDSQNLSIGDESILKNNSDEEVLIAIKKRIIEIKLFLSKINPIYFNALVSLGEMFEAAENDRESAFYEARENFVQDFKAGKYMESRAKELLNRK